MRPQLQPLPELPTGQAVWRGAVTALVVALPAGILNQLLVSSGDLTGGSPFAILFWILILFGGAAGGWAVIRLAPRAPLSAAAAAAGIAYVVVQSIGIVRRVIAGESISWLAYPMLFLLMATCGMLGGMFAGRTERRYGAGGDDGGSEPRGDLDDADDSDQGGPG
jgi:hypothetical protein